MIISYIGNSTFPQLEKENRVVTFFEMPKSLTSFVSKTMAKEHSHIIFNLAETDFSLPHILSAIQILGQISTAEITLLKKESDDTKELVLSLQTFNVKKFIEISRKQTLPWRLKSALRGKEIFTSWHKQK